VIHSAPSGAAAPGCSPRGVVRLVLPNASAVTWDAEAETMLAEFAVSCETLGEALRDSGLGTCSEADDANPRALLAFPLLKPPPEGHFDAPPPEWALEGEAEGRKELRGDGLAEAEGARGDDMAAGDFSHGGAGARGGSLYAMSLRPLSSRFS
jgi:hypothetical protein